jgi:hypothetical protein
MKTLTAFTGIVFFTIAFYPAYAQLKSSPYENWY